MFHELVAISDAVFAFTIVAFKTVLGVIELVPSLNLAKLMAVGNAWGAKMRIIAGSKERTIINFTRHPWFGVLTLTHLVYPFSGHMRYRVIHRLIVIFCLLSPGDLTYALKDILHHSPGLLLLCDLSSYVGLPESSDQ